MKGFPVIRGTKSGKQHRGQLDKTDVSKVSNLETREKAGDQCLATTVHRVFEIKN